MRESALYSCPDSEILLRYFFLNFPPRIIFLCPFSNFRGGHSQDSILQVGNIYNPGPAATKWLQWIRSKWDLWINRGACRRKWMMERWMNPSQQRWRANLHSESGGGVGGGGVSISAFFWQAVALLRMSTCAREHAHSSTPPSWPACVGLPVTSAT